MNFRRRRPQERHSYKVKDSYTKAGRARIMELKRRVPLLDRHVKVKT